GDNSTLAGSGTLAANGGTSTGGSYAFCGKGGGGRVAITGYSSNDFSGTITAHSGGYANKGNAGAGTVYLREHGKTHGTLTLASNTTSGYTPLTNEDLAGVDDLVVSNY